MIPADEVPNSVVITSCVILFHHTSQLHSVVCLQLSSVQVWSRLCSCYASYGVKVQGRVFSSTASDDDDNADGDVDTSSFGGNDDNDGDVHKCVEENRSRSNASTFVSSHLKATAENSNLHRVA